MSAATVAAVRPAPAEHGSVPAADQAADGRRDEGAAKKVLIVDREPGWVAELARHLSAQGYAPITAGDGLHALYAVERERPDLVLLELELPALSGFRLLRLLKHGGAAPAVPAIVLTALSFQEAQDAIRAGADDFLQKPVLPQQVVSRVQQLLR
jgi:DNA-binding response OmpR family regulator